MGCSNMLSPPYLRFFCNYIYVRVCVFIFYIYMHICNILQIYIYIFFFCQIQVLIIPSLSDTCFIEIVATLS